MTTTRRAHEPIPLTTALVALAALLILWPGLEPAVAECLKAPEPHPGQASQPVPWAELGANATARYSGDGLAVLAASDGSVRLRCALQRLEGEVTPEGLWLASTADGTSGGRFRVVADSVGRDGGAMAALPERGLAGLEQARGYYKRQALVEEYSVSADGVRQDFVVAEPPSGTGDLRVELALNGVRAEAAVQGARLLVEGSGRKLAYGRLRVMDAAERELTARIEVVGDHRLAVIVADAAAVYPVRIDPTFSDANWVSLGGGGVSGADNVVVAAALDGAGNLYIGGNFTVAGMVNANRIAKWDGSAWSALGSGMNGDVWALAVCGTNLYAGGGFTTAGDVGANRIAKWDGSAWSALGSGMNDGVWALAVSGTNLYAGGYFTTAGGISANRTAKWDGSAWSALGLGMDGRVLALAVSGTSLYAGGSFASAGEVSASRIAKWDGSAWSALGSGMKSSVSALAVSGTDLYAGARYGMLGDVSADPVARWDGSAWSILGSGINGDIYTLALSGTNLYVGGLFTMGGGGGTNMCAKWDGGAWSALSSEPDALVCGLVVSGTNLYAGGWFTKAGGKEARSIAKWNGSVWSCVASGTTLDGGVQSLVMFGTNLYVGGEFGSAGGVQANCVARWDGGAWSALGSGMNDDVLALAVFGTNLYAGGYFTTAGGIVANRIARWDGTAWSALGSGMNGWVFALAVSGTNLYVGGNFTTAGEVSANRIAAWDGTAWSPLGSGVDNWVEALAVSGTDLYVGGGFHVAGGVGASCVAKWNGSTWSALGSGFNPVLWALAACGSDLYAGGYFTTAGGVSATNIARWDGTSWSAVGLGLDGEVHSLAVSGMDLYVGGHFTMAGGVGANRVAKWNGIAWSALGSGMNDGVRALAVSGADLYAGGYFTTAGGKASAYVAKALLQEPVNVSPQVTTTSGALTYTEGRRPLRIDGGLTVTDADSTNLVEATVSIAVGFQTAEDVLTYTNQNGITGAFSSATGVLALSGSASVASYQAALRSVAYLNASTNPKMVPRLITFTASDGALTGSSSRTITVMVAKEAPRVATTTRALTYAETQGPLRIDSGLTVTDVDSTDLIGATVSVTGGFQAAEDVLAFTNQNGIEGAFSSATGVLTLSGSASVANYQAALRSVTYLNTSANPSMLPRAVTFEVSDGAFTANSTRMIALVKIQAVSNGTAIAINDANDATPYPSTIVISGQSGTVRKLQVRLNQLTHSYPSDLDILLVGPGGQKSILMSDAGASYGVDGIDITFDDSATNALPVTGPIPAGIYKPTDHEPGDTFNAYAPAGPYVASLAGFVGTDPNGTWSLYVRDDSAADLGAIAGGWTLTVTSGHPSVVTTSDSGPGSLRATMESIDAGGSIVFDPVVFPPDAPATIYLTNALPSLSQGSVTIDGSFAGVILDGSGVGMNWERVLIDDVTLRLDGGTNVLANGDFSAGMNHWSTQDSSPLDGHSRSLVTDDYNSAPASYAISGRALLGAENTFYDTLDRTIALTNNVWDPQSSVWIPAHAGQEITLEFWYKSPSSGCTVYFHALRADGGVDDLGGWGLPGPTTDWAQYTITETVPANGVGVALVFYTSHSQTWTSCLDVNSSSNVIRGLEIVNFTGPGIRLNMGGNSTIGGSRNQGTGPLGQGNLLSGNGLGIEVRWSNTNTIKGNFIGTDITGSHALANRGSGIKIDYSTGNVVGGDAPEERNLVSGNEGNGIVLVYGQKNLIQGNFIGTDVAGLQALGNKGNGLHILYSVGNAVGGGTLEDRNIVSGNAASGIVLLWSGETNVIQGNFIGTDVTGRKALGNGRYGIHMWYSAGNVVGGGAVGQLNLVSGNAGTGICLSNSDTNVIEGNFIGTDITGMKALGNGSNGIEVYDSRANVVGGSTPEERNLVSGNAGSGISLLWNCATNVIAGNFIGTDITGLNAVENGADGIFMWFSTGNLVGGDTPEERNIISGNGGMGIQLYSNSDANRIKGNFIGTDLNGWQSLGNGGEGIYLHGSRRNVVGGNTPEERNLVSGNAGTGICLSNSDTNSITGNFIGTVISGCKPLGNLGGGICLYDSGYNILGGYSSGAGNVIGGNGVTNGATGGIALSGMACAYNRIVGNYIGMDAQYEGLVGNCGSGITLSDSSRSNLIGGSIWGAPNVIAGNGKDGVTLFDPGTIGNTISQNSIYLNVGRGISLTDGANNSIDPPVITSVTTHSIEGSAGPGCTVEVFSDLGYQGCVYEGRVQADDSGHFSFSKLGGFSGPVVTATATDPVGNTSELGFAALAVTTTAERLNYTENDGPVRISRGLNITSAHSTNLVGATVSITSGFQTAEDVLAFAAQNGITGAFSSATGVLTLIGTASLADYQAALRSVTYQNTSANPSTRPRVVTLVVSDGTWTGSTTLTIAILDVETLSNGSAIVVNDNGDATPYPSTIAVSGVSGKLSTLRVLLHGVTHTRPEDLDILLVGPGGQKAILMSDAGGGYSIDGVDLAFEELATNALPASAQIVTGMYRPTDYETGDTFGAPAPAGPYAAWLSELQNSNPNGIWSLYVRDDADGNSGIITGGWSLSFTLRHPLIVTTTTGALSYTETDGAVRVDNGLTVADEKSATLVGATVSITSGFHSGEDVLAFTNHNGITGSYAAGTGVLTLSGSAYVADYQTALRSVMYQNTGATPYLESRVIAFSVTDGSAIGYGSRTVLPTPRVVGRYVFYNRSFWDGKDAAANPADDGAIATDKIPLLPGQKATFANYTSYSRGMNGIMVDIFGLRGTPSADDFVFRMGNDNSPSAWSSAPAPSIITARAGAGASGSDRITLIWPDFMITNRWLQVTAKATTNTGLAADDVFYFGNAIGETGDSTNNCNVLVNDALRILNHMVTRAAITDPFDIGRDRSVLVNDAIIALNHMVAGEQALQRIDLGAGAAPASLGIRELAYFDQAGIAEAIQRLSEASGQTTPAEKEGGPAQAQARVRLLALEQLSDGGTRLLFEWAGPRPVRVWRSVDLSEARWEALPEACVQMTGGDLIAVELPPSASQPTGFYRLETNHP